MDEIKFRLIKDNEVVGYCTFNGQRPKYSIKKDSETAQTDKPIEHDKKDRYTGIKDKAGEEAYEGDIIDMGGLGSGIIRYGEYDNNERWDGQERGIGFYIDISSKSEGTRITTIGFGWGNIRLANIIGNVHKNGELIKRQMER